jgi:threonine dehydratase
MAGLTERAAGGADGWQGDGYPARHRGPELVTVEEIEAAAERVAGVALRTPLAPFSPADPALRIKAESLQPIGAFKLRGAYNAIAQLPPEIRRRGVVTHSSGNHAQAVAFTARVLGIPAVLVIPHTAPSVKVEVCRRLGAEVVFVEPDQESRRGTAERLAAAHGFTLVPPFDDPRVIAGQGTIGLEIIQDAPHTGAVLVPVGGGGLISGVATAIKARSPEIQVIGVEPALAADAYDSLRSGRRASWAAEETGRTIADALRAQQLGELTFAHIRAYVDDIVLVSEDEIRQAMRTLAQQARLVAEPAGAVATAAYLFHRDELPDVSSYVTVLSGGNLEPALLSEVLG